MRRRRCPNLTKREAQKSRMRELAKLGLGLLLPSMAEVPPENRHAFGQECLRKLARKVLRGL